VLDKGIVIDAWVRVSLVGIDLITVEARVVVASIDTYLKYTEAVGQVAPVSRPAAELPSHQDMIAENAALRAELAAAKGGRAPRRRSGRGRLCARVRRRRFEPFAASGSLAVAEPCALAAHDPMHVRSVPPGGQQTLPANSANSGRRWRLSPPNTNARCAPSICLAAKGTCSTGQRSRYRHHSA